MHGLTACTVIDLLPTAGAIGNDRSVWVDVTQRGQEVEFRHLHRKVVMLGLVAERPGHAAAAGRHRFDVQARYQAKCFFDAADRPECLLMAVSVDQRALPGDTMEWKVQPAAIALGGQKLFEQQRPRREPFAIFTEGKRRELVA